MIDPAGHAKQPGRQLHHGYERAETFKCAQALKRNLEQHDDIRVLLTRAPGEEIVPLQNASFANRSNAALFISLQFYKETSEKPRVTLYYMMIDSILDNAKQPKETPCFVSIDQAHRHFVGQSKQYGATILHQLSSLQSWLIGPKVIGLPLINLHGIAAPALCVEVGLHRDDQWQDLIEPLSKGILACFG